MKLITYREFGRQVREVFPDISEKDLSIRQDRDFAPWLKFQVLLNLLSTLFDEDINLFNKHNILYNFVGRSWRYNLSTMVP